MSAVTTPSDETPEDRETFDLSELTEDQKRELLRQLGYDTDGDIVLDEDGEPLEDRYTGEEIPLDQMMIMPGSTLVLKDSPLSKIAYLEEHGDPNSESD